MFVAFRVELWTFISSVPPLSALYLQLIKLDLKYFGSVSDGVLVKLGAVPFE